MKVASALVLVAAAGCVTNYTRESEWDPDSEVLPLRQRQEPEKRGLRSRVVLLEAHDGTVGEVVVTSPAGRAVLNQAGQGVEFAEPAEILKMSREQIERSLEGIEPVEPEPAVSFVAYFELGSDRMTEETRKAWPGFLAAMGRRSVPEASVQGHTDRSGSEARNDLLARQRAQAVRDELVGAGLAPELVEVAWHGESAPAIPTADGVQEARNRRVEIRVR